MENEIKNITDITEATEELNSAATTLGAANVVTTKKLGAGEITILGLAVIGLGAVGYGVYKGAKWAIKKAKEKKVNKAAQEASAPAEEANN